MWRVVDALRGSVDPLRYRDKSQALRFTNRSRPSTPPILRRWPTGGGRHSAPWLAAIRRRGRRPLARRQRQGGGTRAGRERSPWRSRPPEGARNRPPAGPSSVRLPRPVAAGAGALRLLTTDPAGSPGAGHQRGTAESWGLRGSGGPGPPGNAIRPIDRFVLQDSPSSLLSETCVWGAWLLQSLPSETERTLWSGGMKKKRGGTGKGSEHDVKAIRRTRTLGIDAGYPAKRIRSRPVQRYRLVVRETSRRVFNVTALIVSQKRTLIVHETR